MDNEKIEILEAEVASAHQEINKLSCRTDATGALFVIYLILITAGLEQWLSITLSFVISIIYGAILWKYADKPFEKLMNTNLE